MDRGTADPARTNIEAPKSRALILSEHCVATQSQMSTPRRLSHHSDLSRLHIHGEQVMRGHTNDDISGRDRDGVNHSLSRNTLAEFLEHRWPQTPLLDPV